MSANWSTTYEILKDMVPVECRDTQGIRFVMCESGMFGGSNCPNTKRIDVALRPNLIWVTWEGCPPMKDGIGVLLASDFSMPVTVSGNGRIYLSPECGPEIYMHALSVSMDRAVDTFGPEAIVFKGVANVEMKQ